jgi:ATP synthase I subunit
MARMPDETSREDPETAQPESEFSPPEFLDLTPEQQAQEFALCQRTLRRIERMIGVAGLVASFFALIRFGWAVAVGVLLGALLSWINFRWLAASVNAIGERVVRAQSRDGATSGGAPGGATVVARGVGRIGLIALFAYVIFECSVRALMGYLAGLAMPVIAMMCEAAYEFVVSRGPRQA